MLPVLVSMKCQVVVVLAVVQLYFASENNALSCSVSVDHRYRWCYILP